jgi:hypothetical protein
MIRQTLYTSRAYRWRALTGLLLLVFVVRAMVAVGYMPAHSASRVAGAAMTLCLSGLSDVTVGLLELHDGDIRESPGAHAMQCAFGSAASLAQVIPAMALPAAAIAHGGIQQLFWRTNADTYWPELHGPPLGPRAPPT